MTDEELGRIINELVRKYVQAPLFAWCDLPLNERANYEMLARELRKTLCGQCNRATCENSERRDRFLAAALTGVIAADTVGNSTLGTIARATVEVVDALLAAEKGVER